MANVHVQTEDLDAVIEAVASSDRIARCAGPDHGWDSVYEARASAHDEHGIAALYASLSALTGSPTLDGRLVTHMDSWPDFPDRSPRPVTTDPAGLLSLCPPSATEEALREALRREVVVVDDTLVELASSVGISAAAVLGDYHDSHRGETAIDWTALLPEVRDESTPEARQLVEATASDDVATISAFLDGGVSTEVVGPWTASEFGSLPEAAFPAVQVTALFAAAAEGRVAAIEMLLARGADPNRTIPHRDTALLAAALRGHPDANALDACAALLTEAFGEA